VQRPAMRKLVQHVLIKRCSCAGGMAWPEALQHEQRTLYRLATHAASAASIDRD
jgi:hypothetical protein